MDSLMTKAKDNMVKALKGEGQFTARELMLDMLTAVQIGVMSQPERLEIFVAASEEVNTHLRGKFTLCLYCGYTTYFPEMICPECGGTVIETE